MGNKKLIIVGIITEAKLKRKTLYHIKNRLPVFEDEFTVFYKTSDALMVLLKISKRLKR